MRFSRPVSRPHPAPFRLPVARFEFEVFAPEGGEADLTAPQAERKQAEKVCRFLMEHWGKSVLPAGLVFRGPECVLTAARENRLVCCEDVYLERSNFVIANLQDAFKGFLPGGKLPCPLCKKPDNVLSQGK